MTQFPTVHIILYTSIIKKTFVILFCRPKDITFDELTVKVCQQYYCLFTFMRQKYSQMLKMFQSLFSFLGLVAFALLITSQTLMVQNIHWLNDEHEKIVNCALELHQVLLAVALPTQRFISSVCTYYIHYPRRESLTIRLNHSLSYICTVEPLMMDILNNREILSMKDTL